MDEVDDEETAAAAAPPSSRHEPHGGALETMEDMLRSSHMAPSAPDTLECHPVPTATLLFTVIRTHGRREALLVWLVWREVHFKCLL